MAVAVVAAVWLSERAGGPSPPSVPRPKTMLVQTERQTRDDTAKCATLHGTNAEICLLRLSQEIKRALNVLGKLRVQVVLRTEMESQIQIK